MNHTILKIDKTNWKPVKFGDIVAEPKEICKDIVAEGIEHVVGLEHIDTGDLHLRKSATIEESTTFSKKFRKGDVLFGRRRAYLKKAAQADFDGICSGDITVLRVKKELSSVLLPFIVNNDKFFDYAVKHSAGGLSPRVKFKDLANYEFLLPSKAEQARLAELLWAMDEVIEKEKRVLDKLQIGLSAKSSDIIWNSKHEMKSLISFAEKSIGKFVDGDWIESKDQSEEGIRLLQLADIGIGEFINKSRRYISHETFKRLRCFEVLPGDVLIARMPDPIGRACIVEDIGSKMITAVDCCIARVNSNDSSKKYLLYLLNSFEFLHKANLLASGTTRQRIARKSLEEIAVPKPILKTQLEIVEKLEILGNCILEVKSKISSSQSLLKSLINQIF
ncbi:MAG: restriction endonuclease subunit S [Bacteroidetes bacterium]|nr:restriction endonuclease subunit S [Bacteroidota bacterium]